MSTELDIRRYLRVVELVGSSAGWVEVDELGVDANLSAVSFPIHIRTDSIPQWLHRRLATLSIMPYDPPTETIEGVGRRMNEHVYWVYYEGDEPWV